MSAGGGFARSSLSLGSAGTRRTVYYAEEETNEDDQPITTTFVSSVSEPILFSENFIDINRCRFCKM